MARKKVEVPQQEPVNEQVEQLTDEATPVYIVTTAFKADYFGRLIDAKVGDIIELDDYEYRKFKDKVK